MSDKTRDFLKCICVVAVVVAVDQLTKFIITKTIPMWFEGKTIIGPDFFRLVHIRNKAAGFGMGSGLRGFGRFVFIYFIPCALMAYLVYLMFEGSGVKRDMPSRIDRVAYGLITGGGIGNLIDRVFRPDGVVDFLDFKFYGIFGMDRWPAFNVADSCVVIGAILLVICAVFLRKPKSRE